MVSSNFSSFFTPVGKLRLFETQILSPQLTQHGARLFVRVLQYPLVTVTLMQLINTIDFG